MDAEALPAPESDTEAARLVPVARLVRAAAALAGHPVRVGGGRRTHWAVAARWHGLDTAKPLCGCSADPLRLRGAGAYAEVDCRSCGAAMERGRRVQQAGQLAIPGAEPVPRPRRGH